MRASEVKEGRIVMVVGSGHICIPRGRKGKIIKNVEGNIFNSDKEKINVNFFGDRLPSARGENEWWVYLENLTLCGSDLEEIE